MSQSDVPFEGSIGRRVPQPLPLLQNPTFGSIFSYAPKIKPGSASFLTSAPRPSKEAYERGIECMLLELGIPPHLKGFSYIREALRMLAEDEQKIFGITKVLYPDIAKRFETTSTRVERAIRHSIELCWERKADGLQAYPWREKPSNAEFLATISRAISLRLFS